jgi:hypothetical protein
MSAIALVLFASDPSFLSTSGEIQLFISNDKLWAPSIFWFLAMFSAITCGFHTYYIIASPYNSTVRFLEYFFTASIMASVIAILVDIRDVYTLIGVEGLMATTMTFGYLEEKTRGVVDMAISPHYLGYVPYVSTWFILTWQFIRVASDAPTFVIAIFVLEFVLFSSFGVVQWYYVVRSNSTKRDMEGAYNILSLTSKMLLVWLCVGGIAAQDLDRQ